jgi:hypothetical protein
MSHQLNNLCAALAALRVKAKIPPDRASADHLTSSLSSHNGHLHLLEPTLPFPVLYVGPTASHLLGASLDPQLAQARPPSATLPGSLLAARSLR